MRPNVDIFLDSGAFTAHTKGKPIDLCEYIKFSKKYKKKLDFISALDDITSWKKSLENLAISESEIPMIPCFHYGEPFDLLKLYVKSFPYISLGGLVVAGYKNFETFLDTCFHDFICDKEGLPKVKVHGFAITSQRIMFKYPWYSVDSTTWLKVGRLGTILIPKVVLGKVKWNTSPRRINVCPQGINREESDVHIDLMPEIQRTKIIKIIKDRGFVLGSEDEEGKVIEVGLSNSYRLRDKFNLLYMLELEDNLPKWPSKLKKTKIMKKLL